MDKMRKILLLLGMNQLVDFLTKRFSAPDATVILGVLHQRMLDLCPDDEVKQQCQREIDEFNESFRRVNPADIAKLAKLIDEEETKVESEEGVPPPNMAPTSE